MGSGDPAADDEVGAAFERGRRAFPDLEVSVDAFREFVATTLAGEGGPRALHEDLYLACACIAGQRKAHEAFERVVMHDVPKAIRRVSVDPDFVEDVTADLRLSLLGGANGKPPMLERYRGRGPLRSFAMVLGMRRALDRKRRKEIPTEARPLVDAVDGDGVSPILGDGELPRAFVEALKRELSQLEPRERNVLRLHFVEGVPAEAIARMYKVHSATTTRWIQDARRKVFEQTRLALQRDLGISSETFASFARDVDGLDATLSTFLARP